jgi:transcriptional regulator with XRE-family HTH domain
MVIEDGAALREYWATALREELAAKKLTAKKFHRQLLADGHDISQTTVYNWLKGTNSPTAFHQAAITKALHVPHRRLFSLPDELGPRKKGRVA